MSSSGISRTSPQLYRDCLRLIDHIAGKSAKGRSLRALIGKEFKKSSGISDPQIIEGMKSNAIRGLSNYLMMESSNKDARLKSHSNSFNSGVARSISNQNDETTP